MQGYGYNFQTGPNMMKKRNRKVLRYALQRRYNKPEVKYIDTQVAINTLAPNLNNTSIISPPNIPQGTGIGSRIGERIRSRFIKARLQCYFTGNDNSTIPFRIIFWHPLVDQNTALSYMTNVAFLSQPDYNQIMIHKELNFEIAAKTNAQDEGGPVPWIYGTEVVIPWPRTIKFNSSNSNIELEKDRLYCTLVAPQGVSWVAPYSVTMDIVTRMTYTDC